MAAVICTGARESTPPGAMAPAVPAAPDCLPAAAAHAAPPSTLWPALPAALLLAAGWYGAALAAPAAAPPAKPLPSALQRPALAATHPAGANLQAVERAGNRLVAAGERGLVIYSDDSGLSWKQAKVPVSVTLTALKFGATPHEREGWAVGNMGVVLRTADGGASWSRVFDGQAAAALALQAAQQAWDSGKPDPDNADHPLNLLLADAQRLADEGADKPLLGLSLRADGSALAVGAYGLAFSSSDGGRHWRALMKDIPNPNGGTYYGVAERQRELFLFGEQGLLLRAELPVAPASAGATAPAAAEAAFAAQASPAGGSLFGALTLKSGALMLFGLRGKVYRSAQPGAPWQELQTPVDASLISGVQLPDGGALLLGAAGQVLLSRDEGQSFTVLPMKNRFPFTGAAVAPDGGVLMVGTRGLLRLNPSELAGGIGRAGAPAAPAIPATAGAPGAAAASAAAGAAADSAASQAFTRIAAKP